MASEAGWPGTRRGGGEVLHGGGGTLIAGGFAQYAPGAHVLGHVVLRGLLGAAARPASGEECEHVPVRYRLVGDVLAPPVADVELDRRAVDIDVHAVPVPCGGGVDGLARRLVVGEDEGAVDGEALGRVHRHRVAVVEADLAVIVGDLVVEELDDAAAVGAPAYPEARHARVRDGGGILAESRARPRGSR